jgi:hypothetical protein
MTKPAKSSAAAEAPCTGSARRVALMKLLVRVVEARGLPAVHVDGSSDPFVKLQLGKRRAKTAVVKRSLAPAWDEEFSFLVGNVAEELVATVLNEDKYFSNDVLGRVRMPIARVMEADELSLGTAWYQLEPKSKKSAKKCRGIIAVARFFDLIALFYFMLCLALLCQSIMAISFLQCSVVAEYSMLHGSD